MTLIKSKQRLTTTQRNPHQRASDGSKNRSSHGKRARHRLLIILDSSTKSTAPRNTKIPHYSAHGLVHIKECHKQQAVKIKSVKNGLESGAHPAIGGPQCDVTLHAALPNKSVVCSGWRFTSSTVMRLQG